MSRESESQPQHNNSNTLANSESANFSPITLSTVEQQEAVFEAVRLVLWNNTSLEVKGLLTPFLKEDTETLRDVAKSLAKSLGIYKDPEFDGIWLYMGIGDYIPLDRLKEYANPESAISDVNFASRAQLILRKLAEKESQKDQPPE